MRATIISAAALLLAASLHAQELKGSGTVALRAARLIDGTGAPAITNGVVVVTDDKIVAVGKQGSVTIPAGAKLVDLGDVTLLPGFIDAHTHIIGRELADPQANDAAVRDYQATGAIIGVANAQKTLLAGFTTIRNVGAPDFDDMALRKAVNEGNVIGPRMQNAGHAIGITGGHCDENGFRPGSDGRQPDARHRRRRPIRFAPRCAIRRSTAPTSSRCARPAACCPRATRSAYSSTPTRR